MRLSLIAALFALIATPAPADEDLAKRGRLLAERWCTGCHVIGPNEDGGDVGPSFVWVATNPNRTEANIREWLADPHPPMPDFDLTATEFEALARYIASLAD